MAKKKTRKKRAKRATRKTTSRKTTTRKKSTRRTGGGTASLANASLEQIESAYRDRLEARREQLVAELLEIEEKLGEAPSTPKRKPASRPTRGRRRGGGGSMTTAMVAALTGAELTVPELIEKVGHHSSSDNKRAAVSQAINNLLKRGEIKRVSRGVYTAA